MTFTIRKRPKRREPTEEEKIWLNATHKELRRYRYFYYERSETLISDYDYDMLEKKYIKLSDELIFDQTRRIDNFVGFSFRIPMILINEKIDEIR